ncbi:MAG: hybrid sensor histidine kinase/response regulator [Candidatus Parabeggiatoa sp. nov. 3]|nr:MAG: hybrid sensor histidine kinase/response regulator [Gammaproteobacteria bacterium]RKZ69685.1 MAG: hybrid sensor histidine kinase/response regulator [Gammaproteobacteria bacterium]RKZ89897.1 MAG: hybrid sensor histidine kinase/response regulator [Gammaproteobacteria bacterium]
MNNSKSSETILVVDDVRVTGEILLQFLKQKGFNVLLADNGKLAIQMTQDRQPDLILLDIMMPGGISGFEVCQQLKSVESTRNIPVLFMTALNDNINKLKGFELGGADYITKPFQYDELFARVNAHLSIRKLQRKLEAQNKLLKDEIGRSQKLEMARQQTQQLLKHTLLSQDEGTELEKCQRALALFIRTVANDLKTPLNSIITDSIRLEKESSPTRALRLDTQSFKTLKKLQETGQQADNTVDALLLLAGLFREEEVKLELLEMSDIVSIVIEKRLAILIKHSQAQIKLAEIWPTVPGVRLWLEEIWMNYISNALKYGGKPPHLELGANPSPPDRVRFWIRDKGEGLTQKEQDQLFTTPFNFQLHQLEIKEGGFGLSMVQHLVKQLGGEVGVESQKGKGSLFYFILPAY